MRARRLWAAKARGHSTRRARNPAEHQSYYVEAQKPRGHLCTPRVLIATTDRVEDRLTRSKRRMKIVLYSVVLLLTVSSPNFAGVKDMQLVNGKCQAKSHLAEGKIGADLTKRQSRFFCDAAAISFFDDSAKHVMVQLRLIPLSQVNQNLGLAGQIRNWAGFEFFGRS